MTFFLKVEYLRGCSFENISLRRLLFTMYIVRVGYSKHIKYYNPSENISPFFKDSNMLVHK